MLLNNLSFEIKILFGYIIIYITTYILLQIIIHDKINKTKLLVKESEDWLKGI